MLGNVAISAQVFAHRAGYRTLEERWEWWYVIRPMSAAAIGILFYLVIEAGLTGGANKPSDLAFAAAVGGLAGLFTERVITAMRSVLGASAFNTSPANPEEAKNAGGTAHGTVAPTD